VFFKHARIAVPVVVLALAALAPSAHAASSNFDTGWKFALVNKTDITDPGNLYANAASPSYDDSAWRTVDLPHDWSIELDPSTGTGTSSGTGYLQGGLGWYRKTFTLAAADAGKRISIEFDGVYMDSVIYLNGVQVGAHPYGYTGFNVDVSAAKTDGTPNVLAVQVRHKQPSSRWYSGSGIYRHVHLLVQDMVHIARHGVFVTTPDLKNTYTTGDYATVHVATDLTNSLGQDVGVQQRIKDASGAVVATNQSSTPLQSSAADLRVDHPKLWSPDTPNLYTLETDLMVGGNVVDSTSTRFGIRWVEISPTDGMTINGVYMKVQGVDLHHDMGALGSAINRDALTREMKILRSMGVNAFRTSHNPPSPEMVAVCDELGIVMMVEAFDVWTNQKVQFDYARFFAANHDADIKEMVLASRNDLAVILWSIGNEIPSPTITTANQLIGDIKSVDTTRPVVIGSDQYRGAPPSTTSQGGQILLALDGLGLNYNTANSVDALHNSAAYGSKFFFESESSSETSTRGVYQDPDLLNTGENYTPGKRAVSSYDNNLASWTMSGEYGHKKDRDRKYFLGQFLWSGFDYIGEPTPYNVFPVKSSFFGAIDTAGFPKDMYYLFKSQWTKAPMVHLLPMNWNDYKPGQDVQVWAYANVDTVELFLNGTSLGVKKFDHKTTSYGKDYLETTECSGDDKTMSTGTCPGSYKSPNGSSGKLHLTWHVPFAPGKLVAVATKDGVQVARDEVDTAGAADTTRLMPDKQVIAADGHALSFVAVDVVDKDGVMLPSGNNPLTFSVTGGKLVGLDNGQEESAENYKSNVRSAFNGKALAIIQSNVAEGPITVNVTSPGLLPQTTTIYASNATGSGLVGFDPAYVRQAVGGTPSLPATVKALNADGSSSSVAVTWAAPATVAAGVNTIDGTVAGTSTKAHAILTGYTLDHIDVYSTEVPAGTAPTLPGTARAVYTDGTDRMLPVTWDAIPASQYAGWGRFNVQGSVPGTATKAVATVTVDNVVTDGTNLARSTSRTKPAADAGYSGASGTIPSVLLDGSTTATTGWSNAYNKAATALLPAISSAHASEWVSVAWPTPQTFAQIQPYVITSATRAMPATFDVTYWNGSAFVPVSNLVVTKATTTNLPSTLAFDPINTTQVKIEMTSPAPGTNTGFLQITELAINGKLLEPIVLGLAVNGAPVQGFDPNITTYGPIPVQYDTPAVITGTPAAGETIAYTLPASLPGAAKVTVTSADGSASRVYTLNLIPADIDTGTVGGSVPATLSLTLGTPAAFGAFTPGVSRDYNAAMTANVVSTAGDARLSVADPSATATGHLVNGAFSLPSVLQAQASSAAATGGGLAAVGGSAAPTSLLTYANPTSNDGVTIAFLQHIGSTDALRTGSYNKTLTFTLSTTTP
jgi:beta-galactosidase